MKSSTTKILLTIGAICLIFVCVVGTIAANVMMNTQKQSCQFIGAGVSQLSPNQPAAAVQAARTVEECTKMIDASAPFMYVWGFLFTGICTGFGLMTVFAAFMIFGRKKTQPDSN